MLVVLNHGRATSYINIFFLAIGRLTGAVCVFGEKVLRQAALQDQLNGKLQASLSEFDITLDSASSSPVMRNSDQRCLS